MIKTHDYQIKLYCEVMVQLEQLGELQASKYAEKLMIRFHLDLNAEQLEIYQSMASYQAKSDYINQLIK
jgi:hypothetical protein